MLPNKIRGNITYFVEMGKDPKSHKKYNSSESFSTAGQNTNMLCDRSNVIRNV